MVKFDFTYFKISKPISILYDFQTWFTYTLITNPPGIINITLSVGEAKPQ